MAGGWGSECRVQGSGSWFRVQGVGPLAGAMLKSRCLTSAPRVPTRKARSQDLTLNVSRLQVFRGSIVFVNTPSFVDRLFSGGL